MLNELSLIKGRPLNLYKDFYVYQPTLGDIEEVGKDTYYNYLYSIIMTSKDIADILWMEGKIWYEDIKNEWVFFVEKNLLTSKPITIKVPLESGEFIETEAYALNENIKEAFNFFLHQNFEYVFFQKKIGDSEEAQSIFYGLDETLELKEENFKLTEVSYNSIVEFLKRANWLNPEYEFLKGGNRAAKEYILKQNYKDRKHKKKENITFESIVSSIISEDGTYNTIWDFPIYLIYDSYYRKTKAKEYDNTMSALYAGAIDTKKNPVNWEKINWSSVIEK